MTTNEVDNFRLLATILKMIGPVELNEYDFYEILNSDETLAIEAFADPGKLTITIGAKYVADDASE